MCWTWITSIYSCRLSGSDGHLHTSIYESRHDFNFHVTKFSFMSSNIPPSPVYGVLISRLGTICSCLLLNECFILMATRLSNTWCFSERGTSRRAWNRHWRSSMVDTRILWNIMKFTLWHPEAWPYTMWPSIDQTLNQTMTPNITELYLLQHSERFLCHMEHLQRV